MQVNHIDGGVYYLNAPVNLGLVINENNEALLIDTGIDESVGRKAKRLLDENGWMLKALFLTHHHADHTGGAAYLVRTTGCQVYAGEVEKGFIEYPLTEPLYLFGGATPPPALRSKFFLAPGVKIDETVGPDMVIADWGCRVVNLAGHTLGQLGLMTREGVMIAADALIGPEYIAKHGIPLNVDIEQTLATYDRLQELKPRFLLPGHGQMTDNIQELIQINRRRVEEIADLVLKICKETHSGEEILAAIAEMTSMPMANQGQFVLANLSLAAYLSYHLHNGHLQVVYQQGRQLWFGA